MPSKALDFILTLLVFGGILQGHRIGYIRVSSFDQNGLYSRGLSRDEIAKVLGFEKANVVSMHTDPENPISSYPLTGA